MWLGEQRPAGGSAGAAVLIVMLRSSLGSVIVRAVAGRGRLSVRATIRHLVLAWHGCHAELSDQQSQDD